MIVCAIEDLLFSIKISTAAKRLGVDVYFERTPGRLIDTVRDKEPALIIFDLNCARLAPLDALATLAADPSLAGIPTLGYVSHVDTDTIARARAAGIGEVLARSAFAGQLERILLGGTGTGGTASGSAHPPEHPGQQGGGNDPPE